MATPKHPEPLVQENHVRVVAVTRGLQVASFYSATEFLYYSFIIKFLP